MKQILQTLLDQLQVIGNQHEELFDTEVRQHVSNAILEGFVVNRSEYALPDSFGCFSDAANMAVKAAVAEYISTANRRANELGIRSFRERLNALQDGSVRNKEGNDYDEFLGHSPPDAFDESGNVIEPS